MRAILVVIILISWAQIILAEDVFSDLNTNLNNLNDNLAILNNTAYDIFDNITYIYNEHLPQIQKLETNIINITQMIIQNYSYTIENFNAIIKLLLDKGPDFIENVNSISLLVQERGPEIIDNFNSISLMIRNDGPGIIEEIVRVSDIVEFWAPSLLNTTVKDIEGIYPKIKYYLNNLHYEVVIISLIFSGILCLMTIPSILCCTIILLIYHKSNNKNIKNRYRSLLIDNDSYLNMNEMQ